MEEELHKGPTVPAMASPASVGTSQADFDALLLEAVIKSQYRVVRLAIESGANVNHIGKAKKKTPLMIAVKQDDMAMVDLLLSLNAIPSNFIGTTHKITALHLAAEKGNFAMTKRLLDAGVDPNISHPDIKGLWTPLHDAVLHGSNELIGLLIDRGAHIEAKTATGSTPLALSARHYKVSSTRYLIQRGANVNTQDAAGSTPLIQACLVGATPVAKLLVEQGKADLSLKNHAGATALDEADRKDMWECALYLWSVGGESGAFKTTKGLGPVKWTRPRLLGPVPTPRYGCAFTHIGNSVYLFGGVGYPENNQRPNPDAPFRDEENGTENQVEPFPHTSFHRLNLDNLSYKSIIPPDATKSPSTIVMDREYIGKLIEVSGDGLTFTSIDPDLEDAEPTTARAATPFILSDGFSYFEATIINEGMRGIVGIGLISEDYSMSRMPGWAEESIGLHSDDACCFHSCGWGRQWGKRYGTGDVLGCGIVWRTGEVFFTLNGEFLGVAYKTPHQLYYAAAGFRNAKTVIKMNFGATPFYFDFRVPTLHWERLPSRAAEFEKHDPFYLFNVRNSLVLFGSGNTTMSHDYWVWKGEQWYACKASGEIPIVFDKFNYTCLGDSIYAIVHKDAQLDRFLRIRPVIYRLQLTEDIVSGAKWYQVFPKLTLPVPAEYTDNWFTAGQTILREFPNATMVGVDGKLCFVGPSALALLDPETFEIEVKPYVGAVPPVERFSTVVVGHEIETFGGWDQHSQRNEVNILDTRRAVWYQPHVLGITPRPRNHHSAALVKVTNQKSLRSAHVEAVDIDPMRLSQSGASPTTAFHSSTSSTEVDHSSELIVHAYGWNGCNYIDDVEILSLQNKEPADPLISLLVPLERANQPGIVNLRLTDYDGSVKYLSTNAIVLAARASGFRKLIEAGQTTIEIKSCAWHLLVAFVNYLHDDLADFSVDRESARMFCRLVDTWAPEHSKRIVEALVLTRINNRSRMSEDLDWAFSNPLYADITFQIGDQTLVAHKCILIARSQYFQSLLMGGLVESGAEVVRLTDVSFEPFKIVIKYLYTQKFDMDNVGEYIADVFMLACKYSLQALRTQVESIIAYNISVENAASLFSLAETHNAASLMKVCAKFIAHHFDEVVQTADYVENAELIYTFVQPHLEKIQVKLASRPSNTSGTSPAMAMSDHGSSVIRVALTDSDKEKVQTHP